MHGLSLTQKLWCMSGKEKLLWRNGLMTIRGTMEVQTLRVLLTSLLSWSLKVFQKRNFLKEFFVSVIVSLMPQVWIRLQLKESMIHWQLQDFLKSMLIILSSAFGIWEMITTDIMRRIALHSKLMVMSRMSTTCLDIQHRLYLS